MVSNTRLTLNLQYPNIAQVAYAMQGDRLSRAVVADLIDGSTPWAPPAGASGLITASKPDGTFAVYDTLEDGSPAIVIDGSTVTLYLAEQVLADAGAVKMSVAFFTAAGARLTTFRWTEVVAPEAVLDRVVSGNYISILTAAMAQAADDLEEAQTIFDQIKAAYGAPLTANTAAAMTDTSRVYVYTGTTGGGFTNGHWYYWNGSAWTDGGVYNSTAFETDPTLTIAGAPADAKATGDAVGDLKSALNKIGESENLLSTDLTAIDYIINAQGKWAGAISSPASAGCFDLSNVTQIKIKPTSGVMSVWAFLNSLNMQSGVAPDFSVNYPKRIQSNTSDVYTYQVTDDMKYVYFGITNSSGNTIYPFSVEYCYAIKTDETLSESNIPADAKKVGDQFTDIENKLQFLNLYHNRIPAFLSLNANYFDANNAVWIDGAVNTRTGAISSSDNYEYAYTPLMGPGVYIMQIDANEFGINNSSNFALFSKDKIYIGKVEADSYYSDNFKFILTEDNYKSAEYTVLQRRKSHNIIPKLFYNPIFTDVNDFPITSTIPLDPVYGAISDKLYKKTIICDGDSICHATLDKPYLYGGWFGRLVRNYQASGKNYAVSGGTITDMTDTQTSLGPRHSVALTIDSIYAEYPVLDYLILEGGTNDADLIGNFVDDTPPEGFGTWDENDFSSEYLSNLDKQTFCGAVEYLFYKSVSYYPHSKIGFIIAMEMGKTATQANRRRRYFDEIIKIGEKWHIPILDLWRETHADARLIAYYDGSKTPDENVADKKFYNDGQHPTSYGYNLMQPIIEAWMKTL